SPRRPRPPTGSRRSRPPGACRARPRPEGSLPPPRGSTASRRGGGRPGAGGGGGGEPLDAHRDPAVVGAVEEAPGVLDVLAADRHAPPPVRELPGLELEIQAR